MRRPVLDWYDEANPECADWQIKWAVEHGVTFFMVDWYWSQGNRHLEHWLHKAYAKAWTPNGAVQTSLAGGALTVQGQP